MAYNKTVWKNKPDLTTPLSAANLNNMEDAIESTSGIKYSTHILTKTIDQFIPSQTTKIVSF